MGKLFKTTLTVLLGLAAACQADPAWWTNRAVVVTNQTVADYGLVNVGQLKHVAEQAYLEMDAELPNGADANIGTLVNGFVNSNNYVLANIGQLKTVAKPFYDQLINLGYYADYPWTVATADDADFGLINVGQLKHVFVFGIPTESGGEDFDSDGLPDYWEIYHFADVDEEAGGDYDSDGQSNSNEMANGTDPNNSDTQRPTITIQVPLSQSEVVWIP